ncbi:M1 family metallopeptidase [Dokdonella immobilis]|uniref:Aminopeptidase n=1 Tax=Dokdonella immobilis TaxID=578942 RepID=A0A1I4XF28_9GAMM|nr:M1 family metallopeptidase [Dokdonella immobilis]SFN24531.1 aminopeptidase N [Dokdonella immobilis]
MRPIYVAVFTAVACLAIPAARATGSPLAVADGTAPTQLPRDVRPLHYEIEVEPHAQSLDFDGKVSITLEVLEPTDRITLNALDLKFSSASLHSTQQKRVYRDPKISVDAATQTASFTFPETLAAGSYRLTLAYTGTIGTQANGLFALDYVTAQGARRALYTQFENSDARKFLPGWDEPAYKATFDLAAVVPAAQTAVSNMPVAGREDLGDGRVRVRFATSPRMSTYLLFFGLGDFDRATATDEGVELGVITQKGLTAQAQFALESSAAVLSEYNDYFGVPYPLPKLDNIAAPGRSQFFGAMENWGAIFTFERGLLLDPAISTEADRQRIFGTAAHEIAHQWFGNLVTMQWWDDLWLNEGFATWMAARTTEKLHPGWKASLRRVESRERAMALDAVASTHPVVQHVATVEQASQAFDAITYSKGAAVIAMLEGYVGADAWREGVRRYMKAHAYANTRSDDLWREVEAAAGRPVLAIAHDFTLQPGVPMLDVTAVECKDGRSTVMLSQGEFSKDRPQKKALRWRVPVIARTLGGAPVRGMVEGGKGRLQLPGCAPVLLNAGQSGYYRTHYAPAQFTALRDRFSELAPVDQLGLMGDALALGLGGMQPVTDVLDLVSATPLDADGKVWERIADTLQEIDGYYRGDAERQARFRAHAIGRLAPKLRALGWDAKNGEDETVAILRTRLIEVLGDLDDADVIREARRRHGGRQADPALLPAALYKTVFDIVASHADEATWERLRAEARAEKRSMLRDGLYLQLATALDEGLARRALDLALTDEPGATNSAAMISAVSEHHPDLAFDFALAHREQVEPLIDTTSSSRYYPRLASGSLDPAMVGKLGTYAERYVAAGSRRATETAIADVRYRIGIREQRLAQIDAWLKKQQD